MASAEQLKALLKSHLEGDESHFFAVVMQVAAHEAKQGHGKLARELRALIDEAKKKKGQPNQTRPIAISKGNCPAFYQPHIRNSVCRISF